MESGVITNMAFVYGCSSRGKQLAWSCMSGLKRNMQQQKTMFLQGTTGVENPATKKYRVLNDRVKRAVASYGRAEILIYVRSIAHLSHN
jgi:hypothetical protein